MMHECRATHVLWVVWDAEFDGVIHFMFGLRKSQCRAKLSQKGQIFKFNIFVAKHAMSFFS